jgi:hypothetical protein
MILYNPIRSLASVSRQKRIPFKLKGKAMTKGKKNCTDVYKALYDYVYYCVARRYLKEKKRTEGGRKINE